MKNCIIVGAGTYGQVYAKYLSECYSILGYVDDNSALWGSHVQGLPVLGPTGLLFRPPAFSLEDTCIFVAIGNNRVRTQLLNQIETYGYPTPSFVHATAIIDSSVQLEAPVYIFPGVQIMPFTTISKYVMVSMGVNIAHHTSIKEGCFLSQGANVGASVIIEESAFIGIGSTIMTGVGRIGKNSIVGAGAVVISDVPDHAVVAGVPAKVLKYELAS